MEFVFGSGSLWGTPLTNISGTAIATPTPLKFGILQDVTPDFDFTVKELYGTYQFPVAIGRGKAKFSFKAKFARINLSLYNNILFGQSAPSTTLTTIAEDEVATSATTSFTVSHGATFVRDLGVYYQSTGLPLTAGATASAAGIYVAGAAGVGTYTINAGDENTNLLVSYEYTTASSGQTLVIANQLLGNVPTFRAVLKAQFLGKQIMLDMNQCVGSKLSFATKLDDFMIPEFDFEAFADASNNMGTMSTVE